MSQVTASARPWPAPAAGRAPRWSAPRWWAWPRPAPRAPLRRPRCRPRAEARPRAPPAGGASRARARAGALRRRARSRLRADTSPVRAGAGRWRGPALSWADGTAAGGEREEPPAESQRVEQRITVRADFRAVFGAVGVGRFGTHLGHANRRSRGELTAGPQTSTHEEAVTEDAIGGVQHGECRAAGGVIFGQVGADDPVAAALRPAPPATR